MTEQEMYNFLCKWVEGQDISMSGKRQTLMIMSVGEDDNELTLGTIILDPDIPNRVPNPPVRLTMAQQTAILARQAVMEKREEFFEQVHTAQMVTKILGADLIEKLARECTTFSEFLMHVKQALRKHDVRIDNDEAE